MTALTVNDLYQHHAEELGLNWLAGHAGNMQKIELAADDKLGNIGYLNLIHPHQIQVLGVYELTYLDSLTSTTYQDALQQLFENQKLACVIIIDLDLPAFQSVADLQHYADHYCIPLFSSTISGEHIINYLHSTFTHLFAQRTTLHGVFLDVLGMGVLIMGDSGTGKSELALELVSRGHRLVADDSPEFYRIAPQTINGTCPLNMTPFLEVRGLGVLNVQALFGDSAVKKDKYLRLIVQLEHMTPARMQEIDRLQGEYRMRRVLDVEIPEISLPVAPGRNLAVLLECAVRNHSLKTQGYNAADDFCERQRIAIQMNSD